VIRVSSFHICLLPFQKGTKDTVEANRHEVSTQHETTRLHNGRKSMKGDEGAYSENSLSLKRPERVLEGKLEITLES